MPYDIGYGVTNQYSYRIDRCEQGIGIVSGSASAYRRIQDPRYERPGSENINGTSPHLCTLPTLNYSAIILQLNSTFAIHFIMIQTHESSNDLLSIRHA
jgi:hypothetical protein